MTLAMGAEDLIFERNGDVTIGVTYMTGTLVKFGPETRGRIARRRMFMSRCAISCRGSAWCWARLPAAHRS